MDGPSADEVLAAAGRALAERARAVLPGWLAQRAEGAVHRAGRGGDPALLDAVRRSAAAAGDAACAALRRLADTDVDRQRTTPLATVRAELSAPTAVLHRAGVPVSPTPVGSPPTVAGDPYRLGPVKWADVAPELGELALVWGAAKAAAHLRRHPH